MDTYVYIDGFNLYYGALKGTRYKWLNIQKLCEAMLPNNKISHIKYYTARVKDRSDDPTKSIRQDAYLKALMGLPNFSITYGKFLSHTVTMFRAQALPSGETMVEVIKTEEKGTDVNIACDILLDCFQDNFKKAVVITNDSDLLTPIRIAQTEFGKTIGVINPSTRGRPSIELKNQANFYKEVRNTHLAKSQFENTVLGSNGEVYKPDNW